VKVAELLLRRRRRSAREDDASDRQLERAELAQREAERRLRLVELRVGIVRRRP
jgi:hypothetical protein